MPKKVNNNKDRNAKFKPWRPLVPFQIPPDAEAANVVAAFQNHMATVFIKETSSPAFKDPKGEDQFIAHLMIGWTKGLKGDDDYWYALKQRVKSELCGPNAEYVEIGPGVWREENFKQTHLWCFPEGATFPIGIIPADIEKAMKKRVTGGEAIITKEELELFVVRHEGSEIIEVFADSAEAEAMYEKNGAKLPTAEGACGVEMIGSIPPESPTAAWTDKAKVKLSNVLAKSEKAGKIEAVPTPELFYENDSSKFDLSEDDPADEEITDEEDEGCPSGLEENIAIAEAMTEAMKNRVDQRAAKVRAVTEEVIGEAEKNISDALSTKPKIIIP